jgi:hypothetical protein
LFLTSFAFAAEPKRFLLIGQGPDGHPPGTHEFMAGVRVMEALLAQFPEIKTTSVKAEGPWAEGPALLDQADGVLLLVSQGAQWMQEDAARHEAFKRLQARKGAIVALHWSIGAKDPKYIAGQLALLGGTRGGPQRKYKILETDVTVIAPKHPVLSGIGSFRINDEFYYRLDLLPKNAAGFTPLLTARVDDNDEPVCWAWERADGGRSFGYVGFHFHENWKREEYRRLATNAVLWSLGLSVPEGGAKVAVDPAILALK